MKEPALAPKYQTRYARVWQPLESDFPQHRATLAASVLHVPASHPVWPWKVCSAVTLADLPGIPAASKIRPEMTHELVIIPIHPDSDLSEVPRTPAGIQHLLPLDIIHQFVGFDEDARRLHDFVIAAMLSGALIPDSDWRRHWAETLYLQTRGETAGAELPLALRRHELHNN